ncbi:hypothetical protein EKO27_g11690 [Xylaria grammica]|uniref:Rhodopsin domain-containing protein n=1 Tax=Xylaria grammica TaxID=363999 RepID=A0A439CMM1_9PEZI|nr:hypothetical protein EKO27_g11690 [Xylaria grammica]
MANPYFDPNYQPYTPSVLVGTAIFFIIISIVAVAVRFYARWISMAKLGPDDWLIIPSLFICIGLSVIQIIATTEGGMGTHKTTVNGKFVHTTTIRVYSETRYAYQVVGTLGLAIVKIVVLLYYRRIFSVRGFRVVNNIYLAVVGAWGIAFTLVLIFQCNPISTLWDKFEFEYGPYCIQTLSFYLALAISDLIIDVAIFALPIPFIWRLQLPWNQKLGVAGILLLGSIVVVFGIVRTIVFQFVIEFIMTEPEIYSADILWYHPGTLFWHLAENVLALSRATYPDRSGSNTNTRGYDNLSGRISSLEDEEQLTNGRAGVASREEEYSMSHLHK